MPKFKGFEDWIEIFQGGAQIDSNGVYHDGDTLIDKAITGFDLSAHEPPLTVGHPKDNAPAFGWVEGLKAVGKDGAKTLLAKFKQVVPEFEDMVEKGLFKKRSASFYPDGRLRHVGFLGAAPPAVKGLADLKFQDDGAATFEFTAVGAKKYGIKKLNMEEKKMTFKDFTEIFKFWKQVEENPDVDFSPFLATGTKKKENQVEKQFSEEDLKKAEEEAAKKAREEAATEFAEKDKKRTAEMNKKEIQEYCDSRVEKGKIAPAWAKAGIKEFMEGLGAQEEIAFSEGKKQTALVWFKEFLEGLPKLVEFDEIAGRDKDLGDGNAGAKLEVLTRKKMQDNKDLAYSAAFSEVQKEHPGLVTEYQSELQEVK